MTQNETLKILHDLFPSGNYPPNKLYNILAQNGFQPTFIQKHRGVLSTLEWMTAMGFTPLEDEMHSYPDEYPYQSPSGLPTELLSQAFMAQPLLGNIQASSDVRQELYSCARKALVNAIRNTADLTDYDCDILTLGTVLLLQNWNYDSNDIDMSEDENESFWEFICNQYAILYDEAQFVNSPAYRIFRNAIKRSLTNHNRLMAKKGQRYYTTLLAHALAPKNKFFLLFEQIYIFYAKNLQYQFIESDSAFSSFSTAMKKRIEGVTKNEEDIYIKSLQSSSAIKLLFQECPYYMGSFVKEIVREIDSLVALGETSRNSYLSSLLNEWYQKRNRESKVRDRRKRQESIANLVEVDRRNIKVTYRMQDKRIILVIPPIRLGGQSDHLPTVSIYQNNRLIYKEQLKWFGDQYCITTIKTEIPMDLLDLGTCEKIELRMIISYDGEDVYCSDERLYRNAIIFDDAGCEITRRPDDGELFYLYAAKSATIDERIENAPQCNIFPSTALLYRVMMAADTHVIVNNVNLFPIVTTCGDLEVEISAVPVSDVIYCVKQQEFSVFTTAPTLTIATKGKSIKQYRLSINGTIYPLATLSFVGEDKYKLQLPDMRLPHEVLIVDNTTQHEIYSLKYIVFDGFSLRFEGYHSQVSRESGFVLLGDLQGETRYPYMPDANSSMSIPYGSGELHINIPTLTCCLNGESLTANWQLKTLWWKDIPMASCLTIDPPRGYLLNTLIGTYQCGTITQIEIGNLIQTVNKNPPIQSVDIILRKDGKAPRDITLFNIAYEPCFETVPLLLEGTQLLWCPEDNFVGDDASEFILYLYSGKEEVAHYRLKCKDEVLERNFPFTDGVYQYTIEILGNGFFSTQQELYADQLVVGDPMKFRFHGQAIIITEAIFDEVSDDILLLNQDSGVITNLQYVGTRPLNGETLEYPCYEGCLHFKSNGIWRQFSYRDYERENKVWYQVNPVQMWQLNENLLALRSPSGDGLYVNTKWRSITHYEPNNYNKKDFDVPAYYHFQVIQEEDMNIV